MTRNEYNAVRNSVDPLRDDLALPFRFTTMLENVMLLAADSAHSTQASLTRNEASAVQRLVSPWRLPEKTTGVISYDIV